MLCSIFGIMSKLIETIKEICKEEGINFEDFVKKIKQS